MEFNLVFKGLITFEISLVDKGLRVMFGREYLKVCDKNEQGWCYFFL